MQYLNAVAEFYLKRHRYREAKKIAERMIASHPSNRMGQDLLKYIKQKLETDNQ